MKKKDARKILALLLTLVVLFLVWTFVISLMPGTSAFVTWHKDVITELDANKFFYSFLAALTFVGGYFATKGR
jgi:hypothetical protein